MKSKAILRILPILLSVLMLFGLAACTNAGSDAQTSTSQVSSDAPASLPQTAPTTSEASVVGLMTFNLRYDTKSHDCMSTEVRGAHLMEIIDKYTPDSISFCFSQASSVSALFSTLPDCVSS